MNIKNLKKKKNGRHFTGKGVGTLGAHWVDSGESSLLRRLERGREIGRYAVAGKGFILR